MKAVKGVKGVKGLKGTKGMKGMKEKADETTDGTHEHEQGSLRAVGASSRKSRAHRGLALSRHFTNPGDDPFGVVEWERRGAKIANEKGEIVFEQNDVEVPKSWSALATNVVISKYFRGHMDTPERETSVRQLIGRVVGRIRSWGDESGYFRDPADSQVFADELTHVLLTQRMAFNSPVWFNLGVPGVPQQASACFINSVDDTMESIMDLAKTEAMLFKGGSGAGSNLSKIRSSRETLGGGGTASGPVSFMKGFDAFAGVVKSGGKTRRAAKMVILDVDHPDIMEFIRCKAEEEQKAYTLIDAGYDGGFNVSGGAYDSVHYQNANHSVRVTDSFMHSAVANGNWETLSVTSGAVVDLYKSRDVLNEMAEAAHLCGDPGMQYDTTINRWNPVKASGRINSSNPCSEYMFLDDTACNLASLNLMTFLDDSGEFDIEGFQHVVRLTILAQEIMVDHANYPTPAITTNSHLFRPLGLGYANLGALLMSLGLPYDDDEGRNLAAALTALMCGEAYYTSSQIAEVTGPFRRYRMNRKPFLEVIGMHEQAARDIPEAGVPDALMAAARQSWRNALDSGRKFGFKNAQVTVLAPTGTIAFMMDCDTTGVEPDIALIKYKKLVGGGFLKLVNRTVPRALRVLGYSSDQIEKITAHIDETETIEGAPGLKEKDVGVFDCAFRPQNGIRSIDWMGHVRMMSAVQPFLSGAISKTVNLPNEATVDDIAQAYIEGWKLGLKSLAVYRDGSKRTQPLNSGRDARGEKEGENEPFDWKPRRRKLPDERAAVTHKFAIAGHEGYLTVGMYHDGKPGEIFLRMAKEGSTVSGLMDTIAQMTSIALQYGVPLQALVDKFSHTRFEPAGFTNNRSIPIAKSSMDYVFRYLGNRFLQEESIDEQETTEREIGLEIVSSPRAVVAGGSGEGPPKQSYGFINQADAPSCHNCGSIMIRNGACYKCGNCGETSGCS